MITMLNFLIVLFPHIIWYNGTDFRRKLIFDFMYFLDDDLSYMANEQFLQKATPKEITQAIRLDVTIWTTLSSFPIHTTYTAL